MTTSQVSERHGPAAPPTLDDIFRRVAARSPHAMALVDPPDRQRVTQSAPRRLTFAQADAEIEALSAHFVNAGLPVGSVIAVQLPNTVEYPLTVLAALRAGLVVALLPQLWRQADLAVALNRTAARAIVAMASIDGVDFADLAMNAAAEAFSIRHVFGFGRHLPDGMTALDELPDLPRAAMPAGDARRAAIVSFDVTSDGLRVVPRTHLQLISGGLSIFLESRIAPGASIASMLAPSSFAGIASSLTLWLLSGGTLVLHHPFDDKQLWSAVDSERCDALVAPGPFLLQLSQADVAARAPALRQAIGIWRNPEQVAASAAFAAANCSFTDVYTFGEAGLVSARRAPDGSVVAIRSGLYTAPRDAPATAAIAGEIVLTPRGTLALRGSTVPVAAYAAAREPASTVLDYVDTGYPARVDRLTSHIAITAPPAGVLAVGGYRFRADDLAEWARRLAQGAMLTALPDPLSGHRLAGRAIDNSRAREALAELGLNPLMAEAFRDRSAA